MRNVVGLYIYTYVYVCARIPTGGGRRLPSAQIWSMRKFGLSAAPGSSLRILHSRAPGSQPLPWSCVNLRHASAFPRYVYAYGRKMATRTQTWNRRAWGRWDAVGRPGVRTTRECELNESTRILRSLFSRLSAGLRGWMRLGLGGGLRRCWCASAARLWACGSTRPSLHAVVSVRSACSTN